MKKHAVLVFVAIIVFQSLGAMENSQAARNVQRWLEEEPTRYLLAKELMKNFSQALKEIELDLRTIEAWTDSRSFWGNNIILSFSYIDPDDDRRKERKSLFETKGAWDFWQKQVREVFVVEEGEDQSVPCKLEIYLKKVFDMTVGNFTDEDVCLAKKREAALHHGKHQYEISDGLAFYTAVEHFLEEAEAVLNPSFFPECIIL